MSVITFKSNDHTKITADFERHEFACPCGCTAQMIDPELVQKMQTIRTKARQGRQGYVWLPVREAQRRPESWRQPDKPPPLRHCGRLAHEGPERKPRCPRYHRGRTGALARSASTGTTKPPLSTPTRAEARLHGFASSPVCIPAPPTTSLSCRPSSRVAREPLTAQLRLCCSGSGIPHDGSFGPATTKALMTAQRKHGLVPDGICGPKSWTALSGADKYL